MKVIAIEEHFLTPQVKAAWSAAPIADDSIRLNAGLIDERLGDLGEGRLQLMDEAGVDVQVLALTAPGLHNLDSDSVALACRTNDLAAEVVASRPERFQALATLPISVPQKAVRELERCVLKLGMKGAMLYGRVRDKNLDHPEFQPVLESAASMRIPLFIHPQIPQQSVRNAMYAGFGEAVDLALSCYALGWHYEAGLQFVRFVLAGVFDRFPELQIILGHWGEVVLFYSERLAMLDRVAKLTRPFVDYARQNLYLTASGMFSETYLRRSIEIVGVDRILFSTDYPYQYRPGRDARNFVEALRLDEDVKKKLAYANWERLTGDAQACGQ